MDYGKILKEGWRITWNHKFLWLLGFIAALGGNKVSGNGGGNANFNNFGGTSGSGGSDFEAAMEDLALNGFDNIAWETIGAVAGIVGAIVLCLLLLRIVMFFIRFIAEAGMIQATFDIANGQESDFRTAFAAGRPHLLPMFGMRILLAAPILVVVVIALVVGALVAVQLAGGANEEAVLASFTVAFVILGCMVCLLIPYGIFTSILYPLGQRGMVLRGMDVMDSLRHAWATLKANVGEILLMGVIYVVLGVVVGIIAAIILIPVLLGSGAPAFFTLMNNSWDFSAVGMGQYSLIGVGILLMMFLGACINAIAVTYRSTTFTLVYIELMNKAKLQAKAAE